MQFKYFCHSYKLVPFFLLFLFLAPSVCLHIQLTFSNEFFTLNDLQNWIQLSTKSFMYAVFLAVLNGSTLYSWKKRKKEMNKREGIICQQQQFNFIIFVLKGRTRHLKIYSTFSGITKHKKSSAALENCQTEIYAVQYLSSIIFNIMKSRICLAMTIRTCL